MRESRRLSMRQASVATGVSDTGINHAENGRKDLKPEFVLKLLKGYGYSYKEFMDYVTNKKETPEALMSECIVIIRRLKFEKLKTVKSILDSL